MGRTPAHDGFECRLMRTENAEKTTGWLENGISAGSDEDTSKIALVVVAAAIIVVSQRSKMWFSCLQQRTTSTVPLLLFYLHRSGEQLTWFSLHLIRCISKEGKSKNVFPMSLTAPQGNWWTKGESPPASNNCCNWSGMNLFSDVRRCLSRSERGSGSTRPWTKVPLETA